jgi:cell wall-associated NlpC family hydrolase
MSNVVEAARAYLGCPFHHQGRSRSGLDCAGLLVLAYRQLGIELEDLPAYGREPWNDGLRECVERNFRKVEDGPLPGDVLLFRVLREPQHLALATEKGMIHTYASVGKVVETNIGPRWLERIVGVYRR